MSESHTKLNKGTKTGADKAAEHLPALTRAYGRALRAAGRRAATKMRQTQTRALTAASADQTPPNWVPPPPISLIDQNELADDTQAKTANLHRQMLTSSAESALKPFDISFDIRAPTSQAILDAVAARIQGTITSAIEEQINEAITDGYANGYSVDRVARNIISATNQITPVRADMLARTDLNALSNAGSVLAATTADAASTKTWLATEDERTRETHSDADGQTVGINDAFDVGGESAQYPGDPNLSWEESANCFPGETLVVAASFTGGFRRWYDGDLILVETDGQHRLSGTPNHPVLTSTGWKALGDLEHGDYLVCGRLSEEEAGVDPDVDHVPAKIEEIFAALDVVGDARRISGANVDFHGEIPDRQVDVVRTDGLLWNERNASIAEPFTEHHLAATDVYPRGLFPESAPRQVVGGPLHASYGIVGRRTDPGTLLRSRAGHTGDHALGAIAGLNAHLEETQADAATTDLVELGERLLGLACEVSLAKVIKRDVFPFHGFVFNLQVGDEEVYLASGVFAHNCRCTVVFGQPLTASTRAFDEWRDHLWEGSNLSLVASSHADAVTSGGDMTATNRANRDVMVPAGLLEGLVAGETSKIRALAATGDTGLPLSERDRAWDAGEATGRVKKWASSDGSGDPDKIDYGKLGRAYFWQDPAGDGGAKIGDFKLPFADVIGGKLTAVWRGVTAGAQRLSQTQGIDKGSVQKKMSAYYSNAAKAFDDPSIKPPWASGSASVDGERLAAVRTFLADNGADVIEDDELRAIILVAESFASSSKHRYAGSGGKCAICGMAASNKEAHYAAETITASLENFTLLAAAEGGTPWTATLCVAGVPTVDSGIQRLLAVDGGSWLPLPLPLAFMDDSPHADMVTKAPLCGRIDSISPAGNLYQAAGVFFDDSDDPTLRATAATAAAAVGEMRRMGISVDLVDCDVELRPYQNGAVVMDEANDPISDGDDGPGGPATEANYPADIPMPVEAETDDVISMIDPDGDGDDDLEFVMCFDQWVIAGATICPVQALTQATITLVASAFRRETKWNSETDFIGPVLTASAAGLAPELPPAEWFDDPKLEQLTALTVTDEGRVFGHMAPWDGCHTGFPGTCVPPPRSPSNYAGFHLGELVTADGSKVAVGTLTMDTGHAGHRLSADRAMAHYDNTGTAAAFVRAGEDRFGIWVAGSLSARLSAADAQALMASKPSGDWREVFRGKGRDLIGVLQVNMPGFPVPRALTAASLLPDGGDAVQFVESEACVPCQDEVNRELAVLVASVDGIEGLAQLVA